MIIHIKTYPSYGKEEVVKISEKEYRVYLKKDACEGKANLELIKVLRKYFSKNINILKGKRTRNKIISVE